VSDPRRTSPKADDQPPPPFPVEDAATCELCGGSTLYWKNCKLVCAGCRHINKTCADL
jgi:hypothetical protein